ncbi:MAG: dephospho-CoA kinase [Candidatus Gastranaerophilales bacterium]|nr:dephospho-CoA kinase [Candidatus Gastranaerophilales bacterium]
MIKYAIVGNIASGKSEMEKILARHDIVVLDTDLITHDILIDKPDVPEAFKDYDVFEYGKISKSKLAKLVFDNPELRTKLENIVHPLIIEELESAFRVYSGEKYIFVSVPLLFEAGWEKMFDKIIFINSDDDIRLERLMERNNLSKDDALRRLNSQLPQADKIKKSDFVIDNNSSFDEFIHNIEKFLSLIL